MNRFCKDASYICMYMVHVCFYTCCTDCVNVCCVTDIVENSGFLRLAVLKYVVCLCRVCD